MLGVLCIAVATALQRPQIARRRRATQFQSRWVAEDPARAQRLAARTRSVRRCSEIPRDEDLPVYPVFDPRTDELPFPVPFDNSMTSYQFTSAAHARLVDAALAVEPPQFFHVVRRERDDSLDGAVGVVCLVARVEAPVPDDGAASEDDAAARLVTVVCAGRGVVVGGEVATFPFARARVRPLVDGAAGSGDAATTALERRCFEAARSAARLSSKLESKGVFAEQARERLEDFESELARFQDLALENFGAWSDAERLERSSFTLVALTALSGEDSAACLCARTAADRFPILEAFLTATERELSAKSALDAAFGSEPPRAPVLKPNQRVSFFWHEDDGWFDCTVVRGNEPAAGWYMVKWDSDGSESRVQLDDSNANRWKLIQTRQQRRE